jgi:D-3-phosphoglycerate dehydrogenase
MIRRIRFINNAVKPKSMSDKIVSLRSIELVEDVFDEYDVERQPKQRYSPTDLQELAQGAKGMFVHSENEFDRSFFENVDTIEAIGKPGTGVDNFDLEAATDEGVMVLHTPGMNAVAVAEFTFGLMFSTLRKIPQATEHLRQGGWRSPDWWGTELRNKTVGLVGLGQAGSGVAKRLSGFEIELVATDPYVSEERANELGTELVELEELFARSDVVSIHTPLNEETRAMIGKEELALMDESSYLLNTARAEIVERSALVDALEQDSIAGAGLDVYWTEPPEPSDPLLDMDNVVATPHLAGATYEARLNMLSTTAEDLVTVLEEGTVSPEHVANPNVLDS